MTLATVIVAALLLLLFLGKDNPLGPVSAILIGSVIAVAASISGDNMQDLKTGHILGATPYKLQLMQLIGAVVPCFILPLVIDLIINAYGLGLPTEEYPSPLPAPQANLIADISYSIFFGGAPIDMIGYGMGIAAFFVVIDLILMFRKSKFRIAVLSLALGLYIPYNINAALLVGGLTSLILSITLKKAYPDDPVKIEQYTRNSVLLAAGLITGEALTGIIFAIPVVVSGDLYLLAFLGVKDYFWPGLLTLSITLFLIYLSGAYPFWRSKLQKNSTV